MSINQRLEILLHEKKISQAELGSKIICKAQVISNWMTGKENVSSRYSIKILEVFPDINARWFLFGVGDMYELKPDVVEEPAEKYNHVKILGRIENENEFLREQIKQKDKLIEILSQKIK